MNENEAIKQRVDLYLQEVGKHIRRPSEQKAEVLQNIEAHIRDALEKRAGSMPTVADVDAVIAEMDSPQSYADDASAGRKRSFGKVGLVALGVAVLIGGVLAYQTQHRSYVAPATVTSTKPTDQDFRRPPVVAKTFPESGETDVSLRGRNLLDSSKEDIISTYGKPSQVTVGEHGYSTLQFTNSGMTAVLNDDKLVIYCFSHPSLLTVDFGIGVGTPLSEVVARLGGYTNKQEVTEWFAGEAPSILYHHAGYDRYKLNYPSRGLTIMFGSDKKAEVIWVGPVGQPRLAGCAHMVGIETRDNINLPFVNDPQVIGTWESIDFVTNTGDFVPSQKQFQGDLTMKSLTFLENGQTPNDWWTWTKGILIHKGDRTASHYEIEEITGSTYMFLEWKSGDYIFRGMKPEHYVLKKK